MLGRFMRANRQAHQAISDRFPQWFKGPNELEVMRREIDQVIDAGVEAVLEVGCVDRPQLGKGRGYIYDGLDIERRPRCDELYDHFHTQSVEAPIDGQYDLIISAYLLEHVPDNASAIKAIYGALKPGGRTCHYVPSKLHPYSIVVRAIGPELQNRLIRHLRPWAVGVAGYPAFFDHCSPGEMRALMTSVGFTNIQMTRFYASSDYFGSFVPASVAVAGLEVVARRRNWTLGCAGMVITADKPASGASD